MKIRNLIVAMLIGSMAIAFIPVQAFSADGLQVSILRAGIDSSLRPEAEFTLKDSSGAPVRLADVSIRGFILARLDVLNPANGSAVYTSYSTVLRTGADGFPGAGNEAVQATYDSGGEYIEHAPGHYTYVFGTDIPSGFDRTKTHTVSAQMERTVNGNRYVSNPLYHFVPNGSDVIQLRKVITNESCNTCHTSLGIHGGGRKDVTLCLTCHNPQSSDPETGNSVDMTTMIHKIHMGAELPSVQAGGTYQIVGFRNSVHDYSHALYPQDVRNCQSCHTGPDGDVFKTAPSRRACASCHDDVNFQTGVGHGPGIPQLDDTSCATCHPADGPEFGLSVVGAHTIPTKSAAISNISIEILEVTNAAPGQTPIVRFRITQEDGTVINPADMRTLTIRFAGPTEDITHYIDESAIEGSAVDGDAFSYAFTEALPADAKGTYLVTIDNRYNVTVVDNPEGEDDITATISADNPSFLVSVDESPIKPRREIVSLDKCNVCHDRISFHGGQRNQINNCASCHHPKASDDLAIRAENGIGGGESISLGVMVHKIHTGINLEQDYTVYRSRGIYNFNGIAFPGMVSQCSMCHIEDVPALPLPRDAESVEIAQVDGTTIVQQPAMANCTSCHDMRDSVAHASLNTTADGIESCAVCHREGRSASIAEAHALKVFLDVTERTSSDPTKIKEWLMHQ